MNATEKKLKRLDIDEVLQMARQIKKLEESSNKSGLAARREVIRHWADKNLATILEELLTARVVADAAVLMAEMENALLDPDHTVQILQGIHDRKLLTASLARKYQKEWLSERD